MNSLLRGSTRILRGSARIPRGSDRVLLTTWVWTGYCGVHGRMAPLPSYNPHSSFRSTNYIFIFRSNSTIHTLLFCLQPTFLFFSLQSTFFFSVYNLYYYLSVYNPHSFFRFMNYILFFCLQSTFFLSVFNLHFYFSVYNPHSSFRSTIYIFILRSTITFFFLIYTGRGGIQPRNHTLYPPLEGRIIFIVLLLFFIF